MYLTLVTLEAELSVASSAKGRVPHELDSLISGKNWEKMPWIDGHTQAG